MAHRVSLTAVLLAALMNSAVAGTVFVADEGGGTVSTFDLGSSSSKRTEIGIAPHNVDWAAAKRLVLAVGMPIGDHSAHKAGGQLVTLTVDDDGSLNPANRITIGGHPAHVVPDTTGQFAYVTDADTNSVLIVDLSTSRVAAKVGVGVAPHGLRLSPDGRTLATANMKSGTVSLVDVARRQKVADIPVGQVPVQVAFDPDGTKLFVSLNAENKVATVDLRTRSVIRLTAVGRGPVQVAVTADHRVIVANQGSAKQPDNRVSIFDGASGAALATVEVGQGAHGVALDRDGTSAYVTNTYSNTLSVIDLGTLKEVSRVPTGERPNGVVSQ